MLQHICSCGRIAEVRHRSNGKKLAYSHCDNCGTDLGNTKKAATLESSAVENIGVKGEFSNVTVKTVQSKQAETSADFKPDNEDLPENLESDIKKEVEQTDEKPVKTAKGLKLLVGVLVAAAFGGGVYQLNKHKG